MTIGYPRRPSAGWRAGGFVGARDVEHLPQVGDALVAGGAEAEGGKGAGLVEEGLDHGTRRLHAAAAAARESIRQQERLRAL